MASAGENVQEAVVAAAVIAHVTGEPLAGVAVTVMVAPTVRPLKSNVGVLSAVVLSVDDVPVSDAAARSGADGVAGVNVTSPADAAEMFPARSTA